MGLLVVSHAKIPQISEKYLTKPQTGSDNMDQHSGLCVGLDIANTESLCLHSSSELDTP